MKFARLALSAMAATLAGCGTTPTPVVGAMQSGPAPVSFDGNVAARATDIVFSLVPDANPAVVGISMHAGDSLRLAMPKVFKRNAQIPVKPDLDTNLVLTKGWPQSAVPLAEHYRVKYQATSNSMVVTALRDIASNGAHAPGIKAIHLRGRSFDNPAPGNYAATVTHASSDGRVLATWRGALRVIDAAPAARLAPSNVHLPPGTDADFQKLTPGKVAPHALGLLLWGAQGLAINEVGIAARDLARFPRYTGGLLVQDTNHDKRLDPSIDQVVGGIIGAAPPEARGQAASHLIGTDGVPVLSGAVPRHAGSGPTGGQPVPGLLAIAFRAGDKPGLYRPTVELMGGNHHQFTIEVIKP